MMHTLFTLLLPLFATGLLVLSLSSWLLYCPSPTPTPVSSPECPGGGCPSLRPLHGLSRTPCHATLRQSLPSDYVLELCQHTDGLFLDKVCNASLSRRLKDAEKRVRKCDILGESLCRKIGHLPGFEMYLWLVKHMENKDVFSLANIMNLLKPTNEAMLMLPLSDPNTCDVRQWLGQCPLDGHLQRLMVVSRGPMNRPMNWLDEVPGVPHVVYTRGHVVANRSNYIYVPGSFGNEASVFIKFILDCWDRLPDHTAFLHDHRQSWHNSDMAQILRRVRWGKHPYISLNLKTTEFKNDTQPEYLHGPLPNGTDHYDNLKSVWAAYFEPELGPIPPYFPGKHHCAQFIASREAIKRRSRGFWLRMFGWLMRETMDSFWSGRCVEHSWSFILGGSPDFPIIPMCDMLQCD